MSRPAPARFRRVNVEITNACNGGCGFCPGAKGHGLPARFMPVDQFRRIASQLAPITDEIVPHLLGEPLMHPDLPAILAAAREIGVPMNIVTNGTLWDSARVACLLDPATRQVSVSLQARPDGRFIDDVLAFCASAESERPDLFVNLRLWLLPGPDSREPLAVPRVRDAITRHYGFDWDTARVNVRRRKNIPLRGRHYLHLDTVFDWPDPSGATRQTTGFCHALSGHFGILSDGSVVPCCLDHAAVTRLGDAFTTPIDEILRSPRAIAMRDGFDRHELVEELCRRCGFIERFKTSPPTPRR